MVRALLALTVLAGCTGRAEPEPTLPGGPNLAPAMVRVVFADEAQRQLQQRTWDSDTGVWTPAAPVMNTSDPVTWVLLARSEITGEETVAAFEGAAGVAELHLGRRDAEGWHDEGSEPCLAQQARGFDLTYVSGSGDALLVFASEPNGLAYRFRPAGGAWTAPAPVANVAPGSVVHWVRLEARPGVDEVALVYLTSDVRLEAILWDGDGWAAASALTLENGELAALDRTRPFDVAYEDLSGDLMVLWGHINAPENEVRFALKAADTIDWQVAVDVGSVATQIAALASEPGSDRIASVGTEGYGDDDVGGMIWDGDTWIQRIARIDDTGTHEDHVVAVAWLGALGALASIYEDELPTGAINWATWSAGAGWAVEPDLPLPDATEITAVEMHTMRGINGAMALVSTPGPTGSLALYATTVVSGGMEYTNGGAPLSAALPGLPGQPFDVVVR